MKFTELTEKEFSKFVDSQDTKNFFQTVMMKKRMEKEGIEVNLVGVKKDDKVVAASLIANTGHSFLGYKSYEAYKGFILDYKDKELVKFMTDEVKKYLKNKKALRLVIDPYIVNVSRDMDANVIDGVDNREVRDYLLSLGYKDNPNGAQVKWTYCLDLGKSEEEIFKDFKSNHKNIINKCTNKYKLHVREIGYDELKTFKECTESTCLRRGFPDKTLEYYQDMFECFKDKVKYLICSINLDEYLSSLEENNKVIEEKISKLSNAPANDKKRENFKQEIETNNKNIEYVHELQKDHDNEIVLACAMFITYGDEVVYLFSGSYEEYIKFNGQYLIQWEIIKYAIQNNYKRYNFYGIQDVFNPKGKDRGVYEFKKGFGGYVEELLGSFELSISPLNGLYKLLKKIKGIIKK